MVINTNFLSCLRFPFFFFFIPVLLFSVPVLHCTARDCLEEGSVITDNGTSTNNLVSPGKVFELGFFTPDGNNNTRRYLGIWYYNQSNPKSIVWVANRNKPLLESSGSLAIINGVTKLLDTKGVTYWSNDLQLIPACTSLARCTRVNITNNICLNDNGNLISHQISKGSPGDALVWQSFDHPTDTFLPGMDILQGELNLTSGETSYDPAQGNYTFMLQLQRNNQNQLVIMKTGSLHYWESDVTTAYPPPQNLFDLLLSNASHLGSYNTTRLVMNSTGQIQLWKWGSGGWSLRWYEPKDRCSMYNVCGNFGSCNSKNGFLCKCLPGYKASSPKNWNSGDFSRGCFSRSETPPCSRNYSADVFLRMPMMKVSIPYVNETVVNCRNACLQDCNCIAYSCGVANCSGMSNEKCLMWDNELTNLQEEYPMGLTIFMRSQLSDIESTSRDCKPCGTYIIPYPLSTSADCGDSSYSNFHCNAATGQVNFSTSTGTFKVTSIDPDARRFFIQINDINACHSRSTDSFVLSQKDSLLYSVKNCNIVNVQSFSEVPQSFVEVEMDWTLPPEPSCNTSSDCQEWEHTSCKSVRGGKRCKCGSKFHWDGDQLNCTKVNYLKVVVPCVTGALAIILLCGLYFIYRTWKRRPDTLPDHEEFTADDIEGIDVAFYSWESILAATNNFADTNKLGTGGFGCVYRGELPDGGEIAVKRLSRVSVQGVEEFKTEVKLIAKLQHRNLVRLIGYCMKADEKILVYEYMRNGSLDYCLFDENHSVYLDWKKRFDIILGIARGLLYLHQDSRLRIIHRDLKPSNILLDAELNPKISDFGIAKIVGGKDTQASTGRIVGTHGYMSPEYAYEGIFSVKSDVFSFGVVLLETISGRRNSKIFLFEHGVSLLGYAWKLWNEDKGLELMDPNLNESCYPSEVLKCIHIGLLCIQEDPSDRPNMSTVVLMLSGENVSLPLAKQPAFMNRRPLSESASTSSAKDSNVPELMTVSTVGR